MILKEKCKKFPILFHLRRMLIKHKKMQLRLLESIFLRLMKWLRLEKRKQIGSLMMPSQKIYTCSVIHPVRQAIQKVLNWVIKWSCRWQKLLTKSYLKDKNWHKKMYTFHIFLQLILLSKHFRGHKWSLEWELASMVVTPWSSSRRTYQLCNQPSSHRFQEYIIEFMASFRMLLRLQQVARPLSSKTVWPQSFKIIEQMEYTPMDATTSYSRKSKQWLVVEFV